LVTYPTPVGSVPDGSRNRLREEVERNLLQGGKRPLRVCDVLPRARLAGNRKRVPLELAGHVIPVALPGALGNLISSKAVLEVVEDGKLIPRHDVRVRVCRDLSPDLRQGVFENVTHGRIRRAVGAVPGDLEGLCDVAGLVLGRRSRAVCACAAEGHCSKDGEVRRGSAAGEEVEGGVAVMVWLRSERQHLPLGDRGIYISVRVRARGRLCEVLKVGARTREGSTTAWMYCGTRERREEWPDGEVTKQ
jgi:hypothetical protein